MKLSAFICVRGGQPGKTVWKADVEQRTIRSEQEYVGEERLCHVPGRRDNRRKHVHRRDGRTYDMDDQQLGVAGTYVRDEAGEVGKSWTVEGPMARETGCCVVQTRIL